MCLEKSSRAVGGRAHTGPRGQHASDGRRIALLNSEVERFLVHELPVFVRGRRALGLEVSGGLVQVASRCLLLGRVETAPRVARLQRPAIRSGRCGGRLKSGAKLAEALREMGHHVVDRTVLRLLKAKGDLLQAN